MMKKRVLSALLSMVMAFAVVPCQYVLAGEDGGKITIYSDSFENGIVEADENSANGGWELDPTEEAGAGVGQEGDDGKALYPAWAPYMTSRRNQWYVSTYYLPISQRTIGGVYTIKFDYLLGAKSSENLMYLCAETGNYITLPDLRWAAGLSTQTWYKIKLVADLNMDTYEFTVLSRDGSVKYQTEGQYPYDIVRCVEFEVKGANSVAPENYAVGNASKIDNFVVENGVSDISVPVTGLIYSDNFESGEVAANANYATEGGWKLAEKAGVDASGYNSDYAFCPGWMPGFDTARGAWESSFYYIPESQRAENGTYTFKFDYYLGEGMSSNNMYLCANVDDYVTLEELRYGVGLSLKTWYPMEATVELDLNRFEFKVYNPDGSVLHRQTGEYNFDTVQFIEFGLTSQNNWAGNIHTSVRASKIDNFKVSYAGADEKKLSWIDAYVTSGQDENEDCFTITAIAKGGKEVDTDGAKLYTAIYAKSGRLLAIDVNDYISGEEITSKLFKNDYSGEAPAYAKLYIWSGMTPILSNKKIPVTPGFDGDGIHVLAIGNSFSQDSLRRLRDIAEADGIKISSYNAYVAGRDLASHYEAWNDSSDTYRLEAEAVAGNDYKNLKDIVSYKDWDYIVLQGATHNGAFDKGLWNIDSQKTNMYWTKLKEGIEDLRPNAKRLVHATWAPKEEYAEVANDGMFAGGIPDSRGAYTKALLPMEQIGADIFSTEKDQNGEAAYIPTAVAVDYLIRYYRFPEYDNGNAEDTRGVYRDTTCHLTENVGKILAGLVWYETLTGIPATENKYSRDTLSDSDMAKLKAAAHYACENYKTYDPTKIIPPETEVLPATVTKAKNGADAIVVFVHDDGNVETSEFLNEEFEYNNLYGTVAMIGTTVETEADAAPWREIFAKGRLSLASHSRYHEYMGQTNQEHTNVFGGVEKVYPAGYMTDTIAGERKRLNEFFPNERILTFIKPGVTKPDGITTQLSTEARQMIKDHYIAMRDTGGGVDTIPPEDSYFVKSLMANVGECELNDWKAALSSAIAQKGMLVYLFHGIVDADTVKGHTSKQSDVSVLLEEMGKKVSEGKIWSAKFDEAMQYVKEYGANAKATATANYSEETITVNVTDEISKIDPDLSGSREMYDYPLTVKVAVPFDWEYVKLTQDYNNREEVAMTFKENGIRYVYANVVPDKGAAKLVETDGMPMEYEEIVLGDITLTAGESGNWCIGEEYDTGISVTTRPVKFQINPLSFYLEVSYDKGDSWNKLDYKLDDSNITEYNFPLNDREILNGTIRDADNIFIKNSDYRGSLIRVEDSVFDTVTVKKGENSIGYAFLAAKPEAFVQKPKFPKGYSPSYAAGYTRVVYADEAEITLKIPDNARYMYVYNNSEGMSHVPSSIKFMKSGENVAQNTNSVRIATWNIGHYSIGEKADTIISDANFVSKFAEYEDYIYNVLDADVIALNEYSQKFTAFNNAKDSIFSKYSTAFEGVQKNYSCNALYAKGNVTNIQAHEYECNKTADMESPYGIYADDYYYITADLDINGETVKLVSTHLAFYAGNSANPPAIVDNQIKELIEVCKNYDKVILMGDWNCAFSKFDLFKEAGYSLANTDSNLSTYSVDIDPLDNIIYKGVNVSDFGLAGTKLSDHYAIYCTVTVD